MTAKKTRFKRGSFYKVVWQDIIAFSGWAAIDGESRVPAECVSYGWVTDLEPKSVRISATSGDNKDGSPVEYNQHMTIPTGCIVSAELIAAP